MKPVLSYLLQATACSGILYGYYHLFLRNKKFHQYNRYYLLLATILSVMLPFVQIPVYVDEGSQAPMLVKTLTVFETARLEGTPVQVGIKSHPGMDWKHTLSLAYMVIALILFVRFGTGLIRIMRMTRIYSGEKIDNIRFIHTDDPSTPFSFFRWLFWNNQIELNSDAGQQILRHELFHIRQKHSWDIILLEIMTICMWVNPFLHLIKREIKAIHEFLADKHAVEENKEWDYAELLLMHVLGLPNTRLTHPFFQNQIKRRIAMLTTSKEPGYRYLRKIMVIPVAAIIIGLFAFSYRNKANNAVIQPDEKFTIVVDPGHGGTDRGALPADHTISEAKLTLELARAIKEVAGEYNVDVVLTREDNKFPGVAADNNEAARQRIEIANKVKPVAFVSIHINTTRDGVSGTGFEAYVSQKENNLNNLLASAILQELSPIYKTNSVARVRTSQGIYVLDKNNFPAVLLQCGYISNPKDLAFIKEKTNQQKIARRILEGIVKFKLQQKAVFNEIQETPERMVMRADSFVYHHNAKSNETSLIILNGKEYDPELLDGKSIIADSMVAYSKNDSEGIRLYGERAANGVLIFNDARIVETAPVNRDTVPVKNVYTKTEIEPAFPGGVMAWSKFLDRNMNRAIPEKNGAPGGDYSVFIQFIVNTDGSVSEVIPLTKHGFGMEEEAMRLIMKGPRWVPGIQNGKKVRAYKKQPFIFPVPADRSSVAGSDPNKEVVVVGYPIKQSTPPEEIVVQGKKINGQQKLVKTDASPDRSVIVTGYPSSGNDAPGEVYKVKGHPVSKIVFTQSQTQPAFPGGDPAWRNYLEKNMDASTGREAGGGSYNVVVLFIVNTDGTVSDIRPLTNHGFGMEEEAVRLIRNSPRWLAAEHNGKKVIAYKKQAITFFVNDDKKEKGTIPEISLNQFKQASPHALLRIASEVQIVSYTLEIAGAGNKIISSVNQGNRHPASTLDLINKLRPGNIVIIESITGTIEGQKIKYPARLYRMI